MKHNQFILVNEEDITPILEKALLNILSKQNQLLNTNQDKEIVEDFISEDEAKKVLGRKTTWFYNMRNSGKLKAVKSANKWWYKKEDIKMFIKG